MPQILLIDDEPAITESLAYAVRKAGLDAVCAGSLSEGNAALEAHEIALIVLDIMLPDGNGLDWFEISVHELRPLSFYRVMTKQLTEL